jgi:hypothetical protein
MLLAILAFGLLTVINSQSRTVINYDNSQKAYYAARSGISRGMDFLKREIENGNYLEFASPAVSGSMDDGSSYIVTIQPPSEKDPEGQNRWRIISEGKHSNARRVLNASVEAESFAAFAYLTQEEIAWVKPANTWIKIPVAWSTGEIIEGRAHTNGFFTVLGNPQFTEKNNKLKRKR